MCFSRSYTQKKQQILEIEDLHKQYFEIIYMMSSEMEIMNVEKDIDSKIYNAMQKNQRKFIVQEQIRILQDELGSETETDPEMIKLKDDLEKSGIYGTAKEKAMEEFNLRVARINEQISKLTCLEFTQ